MNAVQETAVDFHAEHKADVAEALEKMKSEAGAAKANFGKLSQAGAESWDAFSKALAES